MPRPNKKDPVFSPSLPSFSIEDDDDDDDSLDNFDPYGLEDFWFDFVLQYRDLIDLTVWMDSKTAIITA